MTKLVNVYLPAQWDPSPNGQLMQRSEIAYFQNDIPALLAMASDDFVFEILGADRLETREAYEDALNAFVDYGYQSLHLLGGVVNGLNGSAWGYFKINTGMGVVFNDLYQFESLDGTKIKRVTCFMIPSELYDTSGA